MKEEEPEKVVTKYKEHSNSYLKYSGMAIQMGLIIGLFCFAGFYADQYLETKVVFTLIGSLGGVGIALYVFIKQVLTEDK